MIMIIITATLMIETPIGISLESAVIIVLMVVMSLRNKREINRLDYLIPS